MAEDLDTLAALVASLEANPPRCYSVQNPPMDYSSLMGTNAAAMQHHAAMQQRYSYQNGMGQQMSPRGHDASARQDMTSQHVSPRQTVQMHQPQRSPMSQRSPISAHPAYGGMDAGTHSYYMQKQSDPRGMQQSYPMLSQQQQQQQQRMYASQMAAHQQMVSGATSEIKPEDYNAMMTMSTMSSHHMTQRGYQQQYSAPAAPPAAHMNYSRSTSSVPPNGNRVSQHHGMYSNYHPAFRHPQRYSSDTTHMNSQYALQRYPNHPNHPVMAAPMREPPPYRAPPQAVRLPAEVQPPDDNPPGVINIVPLPPSPPPPATPPEPAPSRRQSRGRDDPNVIVIDSPTPNSLGRDASTRQRRTESQIIDLDPDDDSNDGDLILVGATTRRGSQLPSTSEPTTTTVIREAPTQDSSGPTSQALSTTTQAAASTTTTQRAPSPRLSSENSAWVMDQIKSLLQSYQNAAANSSPAVTSVATSRQPATTTLTTATDSPVSISSSNSEESRNTQAQNSATIGTEMNKVASSLLHNLAQRLAGVSTPMDSQSDTQQQPQRRSSTQGDLPATESGSQAPQAPQPVDITPQPPPAAPIEIAPLHTTQGNPQVSNTTVTSSTGISVNSQAHLPGSQTSTTFQSSSTAQSGSRPTSVGSQLGATESLQALAGRQEPRPHVIAPVSDPAPTAAQFLRAGQYTNNINNGHHQHAITRQLNPVHYNPPKHPAPPATRAALHPAFPSVQHMSQHPQPYGMQNIQPDPRQPHPATAAASNHNPNYVQTQPMGMHANAQMPVRPGPFMNHNHTHFPVNSQLHSLQAHSSNQGPPQVHSSSMPTLPPGLGDHMPELPMSFLDLMLGDLPEHMLNTLSAALASSSAGLPVNHNFSATTAAMPTTKNNTHHASTGGGSDTLKCTNRSPVAKNTSATAGAPVQPCNAGTGASTNPSASENPVVKKSASKQDENTRLMTGQVPEVTARGQQQPSGPVPSGDKAAATVATTKNDVPHTATSSTAGDQVSPDARNETLPVSPGSKSPRSKKQHVKPGSKASRGDQAAKTKASPGEEKGHQEAVGMPTPVTSPTTPATPSSTGSSTTPGSQSSKSPGSSSSGSRSSGSKSPKSKATKSKINKASKKKPSKQSKSKKSTSSNSSSEHLTPLTTRLRSRRRRSLLRPDYTEPMTPPSPPREFTIIPIEQLPEKEKLAAQQAEAGSGSAVDDTLKSEEPSTGDGEPQTEEKAIELDPGCGNVDSEAKPENVPTDISPTAGSSEDAVVTKHNSKSPSRKTTSGKKKRKTSVFSKKKSSKKKASKASKQSTSKNAAEAASSGQSSAESTETAVAVPTCGDTPASAVESVPVTPCPLTSIAGETAMESASVVASTTVAMVNVPHDTALQSSMVPMENDQSKVLENGVSEENEDDFKMTITPGNEGEICSSEHKENVDDLSAQSVSADVSSQLSSVPLAVSIPIPVSVPPPPLIPCSQATSSQAMVPVAETLQGKQTVPGENEASTAALPEASAQSVDLINGSSESEKSDSKMVDRVDAESYADHAKDSTQVVVDTSVSESVSTASQVTKTSQSLTSTSLVMSSRVSQFLSSSCSSVGRRPGSAPPLRLATPSPPPLISAPRQPNLPWPTPIPGRQVSPSPPPLVRVSEPTRHASMALNEDKGGSSYVPLSSKSVGGSEGQDSQRSISVSSSGIVPELLPEGVHHGNPLSPVPMVSKSPANHSSSVTVATEAQSAMPAPSMVMGMPNVIMQPPYNGSSAGGPPTTDSQALAMQMARGMSYMPMIAGSRCPPLVVSSYPFLHPAVPQMLALEGPGGLHHGLPFMARLPHRHGVPKPGPAHGPIPGPTGTIDEPSPFLSPSHTPVDLSDDNSLLADPSLLSAADGSGLLFEPPEQKEPEYITLPDIDIPEEPTVIRRRRNTARKSCYSDRYSSRKRKIDGQLIAKCEEFYQYWKDSKPLPAGLQACFLPNVNVERAELEGRTYTSARGVLMQQLVKERLAKKQGRSRWQKGWRSRNQNWSRSSCSEGDSDDDVVFYYYSDDDDLEDMQTMKRRARPKNFSDPTSGLLSSDTDEGPCPIKAEKLDSSDSEYYVTSDEGSASSANSESTAAYGYDSDDASDEGTDDSSPDSDSSSEDSPVKRKRGKTKKKHVIMSDEDSENNESS